MFLIEKKIQIPSRPLDFFDGEKTISTREKV